VNTSLVLLLVLIWPLLLAGAVAFGATRRLALRLVPSAALPALGAAGVLADSGLRLPDVMLGGALALDDTGRAFLLLSAAAGLATGWLARPRLLAPGASRFAVLLLLAMEGGFALALADDALLFFAAGTLGGYALYGLLVDEMSMAAQRAGRVFVVMLVLSDLVVFELLLILSQAAGDVDFKSLRQVLVHTDNRELILGLSIVGFGIKAGIVGVHFWLAPAFVSAMPALRSALVAFMFGAGLLGWLRLLPFGEIHWSGAGTLMQWLGWVTLGYAVFAGLLQARFRSLLSYAAVCLTGLWLAMLGSVLQHPQTWNGVDDAVHAAVPQAGFAMTVLLLLDRGTDRNAAAWRRHLSRGLMWLAALLLVATPVGVTGSLAKAGDAAVVGMSSVAAVIAFLVVRGLLLIDPEVHGARDPGTSPQTLSAATLSVAAGLTVAAVLAAADNLIGLVPSELGLIILMVSAAAFGAWLSVARFAHRLPDLPPGDLLVPIGSGLVTALGHARRLADTRLRQWRDSVSALVLHLRSAVDWRRIIGRSESALSHWPTAMAVLVLLGLIAATLSTSK